MESIPKNCNSLGLHGCILSSPPVTHLPGPAGMLSTMWQAAFSWKIGSLMCYK
jgi:hypothetical protein